MKTKAQASAALFAVAVLAMMTMLGVYAVAMIVDHDQTASVTTIPIDQGESFLPFWFHQIRAPQVDHSCMKGDSPAALLIPCDLP